jgi:hypothetical protein
MVMDTGVEEEIDRTLGIFVSPLTVWIVVDVMERDSDATVEENKQPPLNCRFEKEHPLKDIFDTVDRTNP